MYYDGNVPALAGHCLAAHCVVRRKELSALWLTHDFYIDVHEGDFKVLSQDGVWDQWA